MPSATLRELLQAGVHFGHQTRYWNPSMKPYIFGERNKIHIINLEVTQQLLDEAVERVRQLAADGKTILLVGTKRAAQDIVREKARECGAPFVAQRWLGGTLTNFHTVRNSLKRLQDLKRMEAENLMARISKKEALRMTREKYKLERSLGGIQEMERLPDALFVIDVRHESIAVREAQRLNIPVIAVVDSNSSIEGIDCVIPGNDDAICSIRLYMDLVCKAIQEGREQARVTGTVAEPVARETPVRRKGRRPTLHAASSAEQSEEEAAPAEESAPEVSEPEAVEESAPEAPEAEAAEETVAEASEPEAVEETAAETPEAEAAEESATEDPEPEEAAESEEAATEK